MQAAQNPELENQSEDESDISSVKTSEDDEEEEEKATEEAEETEEEEDSVLNDPTEDIVGELSDVLQYQLEDFESSFYFNKTYSDTFDPGLLLEGIGKIKLPLVEDDAKRIKAQCRQAPFGMGTETVVDVAVRHTWEMDASKVHFDYPGWGQFVDRVAAEVCKTLGVDQGRSAPRCEPYKLLLYEKGSHFLPHQDTEKSNGMFATMVILLPSPFTGGSAQLSFGGVDAFLENASKSSKSISAIAWYTDVTHRILPVTSGYRLALSYNLVHTTTNIKPSPPDTSDELHQIYHILRSWNMQGYRGIQKIVYLLDHEYSEANLSWAALKGADAHRYSLLEKVAEDHDFHIGFAQVESRLEGPAEPVDRRPKKSTTRTYDSDEEDEDEDEDEDDEVDMYEDDYPVPEYSMGYVEDRYVQFTNLVDADGDLIAEEPRLDDESEHIPSDMVDTLEARDPDDEECEGYMGNEGGNIKRWYRASVLVIWPDIRDAEIRCVEGGYGRGLMNGLNTSTTTTSEPKEISSIDYLLYSPYKDNISDAEALRTVCAVAYRWKDLALWRRAIEALRGESSIALLGHDMIAKSLDVFGEHEILPTIESMLRKDGRNQARFSLLRHLTTHAGDRVGFGDWVAGQRLAILHTLRPLVKGDITLLMGIFREDGGIALLEKTILPQVMANDSSDNQLRVARAIHAERSREGGMLKTPEDLETAKRIVADLITPSIKRAHYFALPKVVAKPLYSWQQPVVPLPSPALAIASIRTCISTGNEALVERVVDRLLERVRISAETFKTRVTSVFLPLAPLLEEILASRPPDDPPILGLDRLFSTTVLTFSNKIAAVNPTGPEIAMLLQAVVLAGPNGGQALLTSVLPCWKKMTREIALQKQFIKQLHQRREKIVLPPASLQTIPQIITGLLVFMVASVPTIRRDTVLDCVEAALDVENPDSCNVLLGGLFHPPTFTQQLFTNVLYPLVTELSALLRQRCISPATEPFASFFRTAILHWAQNVLGPRPPRIAAQLSRLTVLHCRRPRCDICGEVVLFMKDTSRETHRLRHIGVDGIDHVVQHQLQPSGASECATWEKIATGKRSLEIRKNDQFLRDCRWEPNKAVGVSTLRSLSGDDKVLENTLGADAYAMLLQQLGTREINPGGRQVAAPVPNAAPGPSNTRPVMDRAAGPSRPKTPPNPRPQKVHPRSPMKGKVHPTKRQKVARKIVEVIDLTTP